MVGSRVIYKTHKRSSVESYIFLKQCCFKRIFKGVVFPPSGSTVVNDRCQGHFREWVQFCLVQSLDEEIANSWSGEFARDAVKLDVNSIVAVPPRDSTGSLSHQLKRTWGRHLQDLAWFSLLLLFLRFLKFFF